MRTSADPEVNEDATMEDGPGTRRAQSCAVGERAAAHEFHAAVAQEHMALVIFFCSAGYDLAVLAHEMQRLFTGVQVIGCTTAGEFGPAGCSERSIVGASFASSSFTAVSGRIDRLTSFEFSRAQSVAQDLMQQLERLDQRADATNSFALLLIDGLSVREEPVTRALQGALEGLPLVGGSAGDGLDFGTTYVYADGSFRSDVAVLVLVTTQLPFGIFKTQHFVPTDERVVVTAADAMHRIVREFDGRPAAQDYARLTGSSIDDLDTMHFARQPMVVLIDGTTYVRSIQSANPDGSLTLFCAIEEGVVLRVARGEDLLGNLDGALATIHSAIGTPQLVIAFDCILRKLEVVENGVLGRVEEMYRRNNVVGFNGYGEQFRGVHVNQTLTGIAFGDPARE